MVRVHAEEHQEVEQSPVDADNKQHMEAKDIRELLAQKKMSMRDIVTVGRYTAGHFQNDKKAELYEFSHSDDPYISFNALHVFTFFDAYDLEWLQEKHDDLINCALSETANNKLRLQLTLLLRQPFYPELIRTDFIDFCLSKFTNPALPYAIRALCMKLACKQMTAIPELTDELESNVQLLDQEQLSPGLLSAKRQVETKIEKQHHRNHPWCCFVRYTIIYMEQEPPSPPQLWRSFFRSSWLMRRMRVCPSIKSRLKELNSTFTLLYMSLNVLRSGGR